MKPLVKEFLVGALGLTALMIILTHSGGFARSVSAVSRGTSQTFRTLQGH